MLQVLEIDIGDRGAVELSQTRNEARVLNIEFEKYYKMNIAISWVYRLKDTQTHIISTIIGGIIWKIATVWRIANGTSESSPSYSKRLFRFSCIDSSFHLEHSYSCSRWMNSRTSSNSKFGTSAFRISRWICSYDRDYSIVIALFESLVDFLVKQLRNFTKFWSYIHRDIDRITMSFQWKRSLFSKRELAQIDWILAFIASK